MKLRFRLKTLFWLTLVAALAVGWRVDRWRQAERIETLKTELEARNKPPDLYWSHYFTVDVY